MAQPEQMFDYLRPAAAFDTNTQKTFDTAGEEYLLHLEILCYPSILLEDLGRSN